MSFTKPKPPKPLPSVHLLGTGTPMCAACGGLEVLYEIWATLGEYKRLLKFVRENTDRYLCGGGCGPG